MNVGVMNTTNRAPPKNYQLCFFVFFPLKMGHRDMLWLLFVSATAASMSTARPGASLFAVLFLSKTSGQKQYSK